MKKKIVRKGFERSIFFGVLTRRVGTWSAAAAWESCDG